MLAATHSLYLQLYGVETLTSTAVDGTLIETAGQTVDTLGRCARDRPRSRRDRAEIAPPPRGVPALPVTRTYSHRYVVYQPDLNFAGTDTFEYTLSAGGVSSLPLSYVIDVVSSNDAPSVLPLSYELKEDSAPDGVLVRLNASDIEAGAPLEVVITRLPSLGSLFLTADGTLGGIGDPPTEITEPYSAFALGEVFGQYLSDIVGSSSFWGNPPEVRTHCAWLLVVYFVCCDLVLISA